MEISEILKYRGFDLEKTRLVRHPYNHTNAQITYDAGFVKEYTMTQKKDVFKGATHIVVLLGTSSTLSRLIACYEIKDKHFNVPAKDILNSEYPSYDQNEIVKCYYKLDTCNLLDDLIDRLIIDWGRAPIVWCQKATHAKEIIMIGHNEIIKLAPDFKSFEETILSFDELEEIINNPLIYSDWHSVLKSINAIYMIFDTKSGKKYIGSSYGADGLFGRWTDYVKTFTGGNVGLNDLLLEKPNAYKNFEYSIIKVLPKTITAHEAIIDEKLYKKKFHTHITEFGLNKN
jgi:hypothetical protein